MTRGDTRRAVGHVSGGLRELMSIRWVRVALVLLAFLLGMRAGLQFLLARAIDRLVTPYELACHWEDLSLSLLSGRGEVHTLVLAPAATKGDAEAPASRPFVELEYALFDLEILALLGGELRIRRAEVDGLEARVERDADGTWAFERHVDLEALAARFGGQPEPTSEPEQERPIDLSLPVALDALRFQNARLLLIDRAQAETIELSLEMNAALSRWNTSDRPARISIAVTGGDLLDGAVLEGEVMARSERLTLTLDAQAGGLRPGALAPYLQLLDLRAEARSIDARCRVEATLDVLGEARNAVSARVSITDVRLVADGEECLALDRLTLTADHLSSERAAFAAIEVQRPHAVVELLPHGGVRLGGLDFLPATGAHLKDAGGGGSPPQGRLQRDVLGILRPGAAPRWASLFIHPDAEAFPWTLAGIRVEDGRARVIDRTTEPAADLALELASFELGEVRHEPKAVAPAISLAARLRAPGLAESIAIDGSLRPFAPDRALAITLAIDGIGLEALGPYLRGAGLERALEDGTFRLSLSAEASTDESGRTTAGFRAEEIALSGEGELFGVRAFEVNDVLIDPDERLLRLGEILVTGPRLAFERDPTDHLLAFGLRVMGSGAVASPPASKVEADVAAGVAADTPPADRGAAALRPLRFELGRAAWTESEIAFVDQMTDPPTRIALYELGFELKDLVLGGAVDDPVPAPASFTGRLSAEGIAGEVLLEGALLSRPGPLDFEATLSLRGDELDAVTLSPYLVGLGIEPLLRAGRVRLGGEARWREEGSGWRAELSLRDGLLADEQTTWLALEELEATDIVAAGDEITVGSVRVVHPSVRIERDAEGGVRVAGLRFAPSAQAPVDAPEATPPVPGAEGAVPLALPVLPAVRIASTSLERLVVDYTDRSLAPVLATRFELDASASSIDTLGGPGTFEARLSLPEDLDEVRIEGEVRFATEAVSYDSTFRGSGLRAGPLAGLLPAGVQLDAEGATFAGRVRASARPAEGGGLHGRFELSDLSWGVPGAEPWFGCTRVAVEGRRIDPLADRIDLGEVRVEGTTVRVERDVDGTIHAFGLRVDPAPASVELVDGDVSAGAGDGDAPVGEADAPRAAAAVPPRIELLEGLSVELSRFVVRDAGLGADALPIAGSVRLELEPCVLIDPDPAGLPPISWSVHGALDDLVRDWSVTGGLTPFAPEPRVAAQFRAAGLRTAGLLERVPALAAVASGELDEGEMSGSCEATFSVRRARPFELGLGRAFSADASVGELAFREAPGGRVLAGLEGIDIDVGRVDLARNLVQLRSVEIRTPRVRVTRDEAGIHALGFVLREPAEASPAEAAAPVAPAAAPPGALPRTGAEPEAAAPGLDLRVDRLTLAGLDVSFQDVSVTPPLSLTLAELDVQARGISTRALDRAVPFSVLLGPALDGERGAPIFEEVVASGRVSFAGAPAGRAKLQLVGLELRDFAGYTAEQGLSVEDGALDANVRLRLLGDKGAEVDTKLVFSDLDLKEAEGGFLQRALSLPMALDSVLFLLRNASGEHRIGLSFGVDASGVSTGELVLAAAGALAEVVAKAVAGAPLRLLSALVPGGDAQGARVRDVQTIDFAPGSTELTGSAQAVLAEAAWRLGKRRKLVARLKHEVGREDLLQAERLANPSEEDCLELAADLRRRKTELGLRIAARKLEARALYAIGSDEAGAATIELRALERDSAELERSLDQVFEVLRSDSARQRWKRTRNVARELADLRLADMARILRTELRVSDADRVELGSVRIDAKTELERSRVSLEILER